jgi:hypothetical protein
LLVFTKVNQFFMKPPRRLFNIRMQNALTVAVNDCAQAIFLGRRPVFYLLAFLLLLFTKAPGQQNSFPYGQSFEESFRSGTAVDFLPHWWGNEVAASARIFQSPLARSGAAALAAEPTSSFVADIRLRLDTRGLPAAHLSFWAGSAQNGSGSRPSLLYLSFSTDGGASFSTPQLLASLPNANTAYQQYSLPLPQALMQLPEAVIRWQIRRSEEGAGTAARILIDDVLVEAATPRLQLLSAEARSATVVVLLFNMPVEKASAENLAHYSLQPATAITGAQLSTASPEQVVLQTSPLAAGDYTLSAAGILPANGGAALSATHIDFYYAAAPGYRDIVINEIFADPNPKGSVRPQPTVLPTDANAEFVELFNASETPHNLEQLRLSGGRLPPFVLDPGAYVIAVPAGKADLYAPWGDVVEVQGWKNLTNSGTRLELTDASTGRLLDSLSYTLSWYRTPGKQEGGWSLEQINPYLQCSYAGNWQASTDSKGATPGAANAVLDSTAKQQAPRLLQAVAETDQQLVLLFDDYIAPASLENALFELEPQLPLAEILHEGQRLLLRLERPLSENGAYRLQLSGLQDCHGNELVAEAPLIRPKSAQPGDVVINEIMFDPEAGDAEWIELHNPGPHYLNLQGWYIGLRDKTLRSTVPLSNQLLLLPPQGYLVLSRNPASVQEAFSQAVPERLLELPGLPQLRNSGDTLVLLTPLAQVAEVVAFAPALHHPLLSTTKGVALERLDPHRSGLLPANWTSAAAPSYGTPTQPNSQRFAIAPGSEVLRLEPGVLEPTPDGVNDVTFIHYQLPQAGLSGTLLILDASGREIVRLADNQLLGNEGTFQWGGTSSSGQRVRNGYYIVVLSVWGREGFRQKWQKTVVVSSWL